MTILSCTHSSEYIIREEKRREEKRREEKRREEKRREEKRREEKRCCKTKGKLFCLKITGAQYFFLYIIIII